MSITLGRMKGYSARIAQVQHSVSPKTLVKLTSPSVASNSANQSQ